MQWVTDQAAIIAVLAVVLMVVGVAVAFTKQYHKVAPNQVAVISGRKRKTADGGPRGYRIVTGGGFFLLPVLERIDYLHLNVMTFPVNVQNVPDKNGVPVSVQAIANVKLMSDEASLALAVERFLGFQRENIQAFAKENLESNLRAIVGTMTIEELIKDRASLQANAQREAVGDLAKLGLGVDLLNVQDVRDERGYIDALGKKRTEEVKRDAVIGEAEARRDAKIRSSEADQLGSTAAAQNQQKISDAERERDLVKAANEARVKAAQARIPIVAEIAAAEEQKNLNVADVAASQARVEAEARLQEAERVRHQKELEATVIVKAEKEREAAVIAATAQEQAAVKLGEAARIRMEKEGQGAQAKMTAEATGRKAAASALQAEREAEAAGELAGLRARAEGVRQQGLAEAEAIKARALGEAEGVRARALAEAEGALKKAEAFKELDEAGRFLMILEASPTAIAAVGQAVAAAIKPAAEAIGQGISAIDEVRVVDLGGRRNGESLVKDFADLPVQTLLGLVEQFKAAGVWPAIQNAISSAGMLTKAPEPPAPVGAKK